eukprot:31386-Pelagococcus_subviridis.AAC.8
MGPRPEGHLETLAKLVAAGADVAAADKTGSTPLHRAASQGRVKIVAALLDGSLPGGATCDVEARNGVRQTPLLVACEVRSPYTGPHTTASALFPARLSAQPSLSIPALDAFQLQPTPLNSTPTFARRRGSTTRRRSSRDTARIRARRTGMGGPWRRSRRSSSRCCGRFARGAGKRAAPRAGGGDSFVRLDEGLLEPFQQLFLAREQPAADEDDLVQFPLPRLARRPRGDLVHFPDRLQYFLRLRRAVVVVREQDALRSEHRQLRPFAAAATFAFAAAAVVAALPTLPQQPLQPRLELPDVDPPLDRETHRPYAGVVHRARGDVPRHVPLHALGPEPAPRRLLRRVLAQSRPRAASPRDGHRALVQNVLQRDDASRRPDDLRLRVHRGQRSLDLVRVALGDEVELVQDDHVRVRDLQRRLFPLSELLRDVRRVHEGDDRVEDRAVFFEELVVDPELLRDRSGVREPGRLEEDEVELFPAPRAALHERVYRLYQAPFHGAAHAAVVHLHPLLDRCVVVAAFLIKIICANCVDADVGPGAARADCCATSTRPLPRSRRRRQRQKKRTNETHQISTRCNTPPARPARSGTEGHSIQANVGVEFIGVSWS